MSQPVYMSSTISSRARSSSSSATFDCDDQAQIRVNNASSASSGSGSDVSILSGPANRAPLAVPPLLSHLTSTLTSEEMQRVLERDERLSHLSSIGRSDVAVTIPSNSIGLRYLHDFITPDECEQLIATAHAGGFERSTTGGGVDPVRTSFSSPLRSADPLVTSITSRVAQLTGLTTDHIEPLKVVRYEPGQFYKPHHDDYPHWSNPRRYTVLVYLNDVEGEGGETDFPLLDVRVKPKRGAALFWSNFTAAGAWHKNSLHQGLPPKSGVKLALNIWVRFAAS